MPKQFPTALAPQQFLSNIISTFTICSLLLFSNNVLAQPNLQWDKTFGGNGFERLQMIIPSNDGNYLVGGMTDSDSSGTVTQNGLGQGDFYISKLDDEGKFLADFRYGGNRGDQLNYFQQTTDGGFILGGSSSSGIGGDKTEANYGAPWTSDCWIIKTDAAGTIQWDKTFGGSENDQLQAIVTTDNGYLLGGSSRSSADGIKSDTSRGMWDFWVIKIDLMGNLLWDKTYGGAGNDFLHNMTSTGEGNVLLSGSSDSEISGDKSALNKGGTDFWTIKINSLGDILWDKTFGGSGDDQCKSVIATNDGGYLLGGSSDGNISGDKTEDSRGQSDFWVIKTDFQGNVLWDKTIGGSDDDELFSQQQNDKNTYLLAGYTASGMDGDKTSPNKGGHDFWLVYLDNSGNLLADQSFGGSLSDDANSLLALSDGSYLLAGASASGISGDKSEGNFGDFWTKDFWVTKMSCDTIVILDTLYLCEDATTVIDTQNDLTQACSWLWSDGSTEAIKTILGSSSQNYSVTVSDVFACSSSRFIEAIVLSPDTTYTSINLCKGDSILLSGSFQQNAGIYVDNITSFYGCDSTVISTLAFYPNYNEIEFLTSCNPVDTGIIIQNHQTIYGCDSIVTKHISLIEKDSTWVTHLTCNKEELGIFTEVFHSLYECDSIVMHNFQLDSFEIHTTASNDNCISDEGLIIVDSVTGGKAPYRYALNGEDFQTSRIFFGLNSAKYHTLTIEDAAGCENETSVLLPLMEDFNLTINRPGKILLGDSVTFSLAANEPLDTLIWESYFSLSCSNCANPTSKPTETTRYQVQAISVSGCIVTKEIQVVVEKPRLVYLPNAFSPNGDDINEVYEIFGGPEVLKFNSLRIFDRWGGEVFAAHNFEPGDLEGQWGGNLKGQKAGTGMFLAVVEVLFVDGHVELISTEVNLLR